MTILVIGNGFDLAHDLPTSYSDFLSFVCAYKNYKENSACDEEYYQYLKETEQVYPTVF